MENYGLTQDELAILRRLTRPEKIQSFLDDEVGYNNEKDGETLRSPRRVLRDRLAHCAEGAFLAAAALRVNGYPPLILDMVAVRDDDHLLAIYKERGYWGAVAQSHFTGLRFREPVYRTLRELIMSYYEHYYNLDGEKTLREFSGPINLRRFDGIAWMTTEADLWVIPEYLGTIRHWPVMPPELVRKRRQIDGRLYRAGLMGYTP